MPEMEDPIVYQVNDITDLCDGSLLRRLKELSIERVGIALDFDESGDLLIPCPDGLVDIAARCEHDGSKIDVISVGDSFFRGGDKPGEILGRLSGVVSIAQKLGASLIRWETALLGGLDSQEKSENLADLLKAIGKSIEETDLELGIESNEGTLMDVVAVRDLLDKADCHNVGVSLNPSKFVFEGAGKDRKRVRDASFLTLPPAAKRDKDKEARTGKEEKRRVEQPRHKIRRFLKCYYLANYRYEEGRYEKSSLWSGNFDFVSLLLQMHFSRDVPPEHIIVEDEAIERYLKGEDSDLFYISEVLNALREYSQGHPFLRRNRVLSGYASEKEWGGAELIPDEDYAVSSDVTYTLRLTVGDSGIAAGGIIRVQQPPLWKAGNFQIISAEARGYLSVSSSSLKTGLKVFTRPYPVPEVVIGVCDKSLVEGDTVDIIFGDRSQGSPGVLSCSDMVDVDFYTGVDQTGDEEYLLMKDRPALRITNGPAGALSIVVPSIVKSGEEVRMIVRADDRIGYPCASTGKFKYDGRVQFGCEEGLVPLPEDYRFSDEDRGVHEFRPGPVVDEGVDFISARDRAGSIEGSSNPIMCKEDPEHRIFWGEIHTHTVLSDGRRSLDFLYQYARNYAGLDFTAAADHSTARSADLWDMTKKAAEKYNDPHRFVTLLACEFSYSSPYSDRNAYFKDTKPPIIKERKLESVWKWIEQNGGMMIPHQIASPGMPIDWDYHNPKVERLVEVISCHGNFEKADMPYGFSEMDGLRTGVSSRGSFYQDALARGYRLGVIGSSDSHDTHAGHTPYGSWRSAPLAAVYAKELTRDAIFEAMWNRQCYATSGARIILDVTINGFPMGSEIGLDCGKTDAFSVRTRVIGTERIDKIEVIRNNREIHTSRPEGKTAEFELNERISDLGGASEVFYYVRVSQEDGEMAWSSPIFLQLINT